MCVCDVYNLEVIACSIYVYNVYNLVLLAHAINF